MSGSTLTLNCWTLGDQFDNTFSVEILPVKNVGQLKDAIKEKKKLLFDHVDADTLVLLQVSIYLHDDNYEEELKKLDLKSLKQLSARMKLSSCFANQMEEHLDIIIKRPREREFLLRSEHVLTSQSYQTQLSSTR